MKWRRTLPPAIGGFLGAAYYLKIFGIASLNPRNLDWLLTYHDRAQHLLGWLFFKEASWGLPLGKIDGLMAPVGTSVAFTDSIPWLAVLCKAAFAWVDGPFQYSGVWLLFCFAMVGVIGVLLARRFSRHSSVQILAAAFLVVTPAMLWRTGHIALTGMFVILLAVLLYARQDASGSGRNIQTASWTTLAVFSAGVHPYLAALVLAVATAGCLRSWRDRSVTFRRALVHLAAPVSGAFVVWFVFGYFTEASVGAGGFGQHSANLLTFVNPMGISRFLGSVATPPRQASGFAYLGLGMLALITVATIMIALELKSSGTRALRLRMQPYLPLAAAGLLTFGFALATPVYLGMTPVLTLDWLYSRFPLLTEVFRASGRLVWLLQYCLMLAALATVARLPRRLANLLLGAALILQVVDISPLIDRHSREMSEPTWEGLTAPGWQRLHTSFATLALVPPHIKGSTVLPHDYKREQWIPFALLAATTGMQVNSARVARVPSTRMEEACRNLLRRIKGGDGDQKTVYVVDPVYFGAFRWWSQDRHQCRTLEHHILCATSLPAGIGHPVQDSTINLNLELGATRGQPPIIKRLAGFGKRWHAGRTMVKPVAEVELAGELRHDVAMRFQFPGGLDPQWTVVDVSVGEHHAALSVADDRRSGTVAFNGIDGESVVHIALQRTERPPDAESPPSYPVIKRIEISLTSPTPVAPDARDQPPPLESAPASL